jgi:hypothetical protein
MDFLKKRDSNKNYRKFQLQDSVQILAIGKKSFRFGTDKTLCKLKLSSAFSTKGNDYLGSTVNK